MICSGDQGLPLGLFDERRGFHGPSGAVRTQYVDGEVGQRGDSKVKVGMCRDGDGKHVLMRYALMHHTCRPTQNWHVTNFACEVKCGARSEAWSLRQPPEMAFKLDKPLHHFG